MNWMHNSESCKNGTWLGTLPVCLFLRVVDVSTTLQTWKLRYLVWHLLVLQLFHLYTLWYKCQSYFLQADHHPNFPEKYDQNVKLGDCCKFSIWAGIVTIEVNSSQEKISTPFSMASFLCVSENFPKLTIASRRKRLNLSYRVKIHVKTLSVSSLTIVLLFRFDEQFGRHEKICMKSRLINHQSGKNHGMMDLLGVGWRK